MKNHEGHTKLLSTNLFQLKVNTHYEVQGQLIDCVLHGYHLYDTGPVSLHIRSAAIDLTNTHGYLFH